MINTAIISPSQNAYSETFIQAHKRLEGNIFYYYGDKSFLHLEGEGPLPNMPKTTILKVKRKLFKKPYSYLQEQLLIKSFKKNNIQVVLAEYGVTAAIHLPAIKQLNLPLIVHFHGYDASRKDIIKRYNNYKEVFDYSSYIIVVSKKMHDDILNMGCREEKIIYNPCGPHDKFLDISPKFTNQQFISVGRFVDKKAPYYTLLAFSKILNNYPEAKLVMAGDGVLINTCKNIAQYLGMESSVSFPGIITPENYRKYLENSLAFLQHSITAENGDSEGTPVAILEASGAGLPVISTIHAGIPDIIINGTTGLLVKEHDVDSMAQKMKVLLDNLELAKEMGRKGKKNVYENYSIEKHLEKINHLINSAVKFRMN
ncbi:glycosyltransferase [Christiangramia sediminis]|uniref:Glycosyltransferase n=1 Tax=Christiangramia sediminis TaxID=2881336 RepID=A0A9X1RYI5_9FLAO|nr:glycosyltransferase [Christiangramia sediminis]MCB7481325.1 glycosyltransferase [Christiangramia sediminis]